LEVSTSVDACNDCDGDTRLVQVSWYQ
jgi:hypothetical protein